MGRSRRSTHWEFFSPRLGGRVVAASSLEYEHYVSLECDPTVETYEPQVKVTVTVDGEPHVTILDSKVRHRDGRIVVNEVKFAEQVTESEKQIQVQRALAQQNGWLHQVLTENEIRADEVYLRNCHAMLGWAQPIHTVPDSGRTSIVGLISGQGGELTVAAVSAATGRPVEEVVSVVVREYIAGRVDLPNIRSVKLSKLTTVGRAA